MAARATRRRGAIILFLTLPFATPCEYIEALRSARIDCHLLLETRRSPRSRFQQFCCGPLVSIQKVWQIIALRDRAALVWATDKTEKLIASLCGSAGHENVRTQVHQLGGLRAVRLT
jgi:hypothetical protein